MIVVTGGAGFIGSALVWALNKRGEQDIMVVDEVDHEEKEHNLALLKYETIVGGADFREALKEGRYDGEVQVIFHLGAITSTTENDWQKFADTNVDFSQEIIRWCVDKDVRCVYISSGAVYGDGRLGYSDGHDLFDDFRPLNFYGKSKLDVDIWARDAGYLDKVVGLRYFNVFGPNEYHKEAMRSVVAKKFDGVVKEGVIELFKSNNKKYGDGEQMRDFIYVKDAVAATLFFLDQKEATGVFNVGTGQARSWNDLAEAMFASVGRRPNIKYIDIPGELAEQYQDFTQADIGKLREAGYKNSFTNLEEAVDDYINNYLSPHVHLGEN